MRTQSEGDLNLNDKMDWSRREEIGIRKKNHIARWLEYQSSQLEKKGSRLYSRLIRKSNAMNGLLYSPRNAEVVREQMLQVDDLFKMVTEVHKKCNALLPVEQQEKDEDWLDEILIAACCSSNKRSLVGSEMLRGKEMLLLKQSQKGQVCLEDSHQRGQVDIEVCHHQTQGHQRVTKR